ncbi:MAG TPA: sugar ABC transporter permease [Actinomycetota bacterium]|jgi:D-xylose transport system permease protein|nr:sugar ABC transporter permease [Actinomycetota bacterium]
MTISDLDPRLATEQPGLAGAWAGFRRRLSQGELGSLPVVLGIAIIWLIFWIANSRFLSADNLTNLVLQIAPVGTIAVGVVLVLLLGEIDLSVGTLSGLCAAIMAVLNVQHGVPGWLAILAGLATGTAVGAFQGFWTTRFRIPAFVVTLAGLLAWLGALLFVLGSTGTVNLSDTTITGLENTFFIPLDAWLLAVIVIVVYAASKLWERRQRSDAGLPVPPLTQLVTRVVVLAAAVLAVAAVLTAGRGLPLGLVIFVGIVVAVDLLIRRTTFGRHVLAVGGNAEAARRAGIGVNNVRLMVFMLASTLAAAGGILAAARLFAVNQSSGGSDTLLNAIAAAVIGGTSLFGGRGSAWSALLGAVVIGSIANGMDLVGVQSSTRFMVTGGVLLLAATVDALSRRGRQAAGRA